MVEDKKRASKDLNLISQTRDNKLFLNLYPEKNWVNIEKQTVICGIASLFVKHSEFEWKRV